MGCQWNNMGKQMLSIKPFRESIIESSKVVEPYGVDLFDQIERGIGSDANHVTIAIIAIEIALVDLLRLMKVKIDKMFGHSLGETGCGYADGCYTKEEAMLMTYWKAFSSYKGKGCGTVEGKMIAVGISLEEAYQVCPGDCSVAAWNGEKSVTLSGPATSITAVEAQLKEKGVFVRPVNSMKKAFHSQLVDSTEMYENLGGGKISRRLRSDKWLSTSVPEEEWNEDKARYSGLDYLCNNSKNTVLYYPIVKKIPQDAIVIEVAPSPLFTGMIKRTVGGRTVAVLSLMKANHENNAEFFMNQMGQLYCLGVDMNPLSLHEPVEFPVPKGTPLVSPIIQQQWDHSVSHFLADKNKVERKDKGNERTFDIDPTKEEHRFYQDYKINGEHQFPAGGLLVLAWKTLADLILLEFQEMDVVFRDVQFIQQLNFTDTDTLALRCRIQSDGSFEVTQDSDHSCRLHTRVLVKGFVLHTDPAVPDFACDSLASVDVPERQLGETHLNAAQVDQVMQFKGWDNKRKFRNILRSNLKYTQVDLLWNGNWAAHLENILQCITQSQGVKSYREVSSIGRLQIEPLEHWENSTTTGEGEVYRLRRNMTTDTTVCGHIAIQHVTLNSAELPEQHGPISAERMEFIPYKMDNTLDNGQQDYASACLQYAVAGLKRLMMQDSKSNVLPNVAAISKCVSGYKIHAEIDGQLNKYSGGSMYGMADFLQRVMNIPVEDVFSKNVTDIYRHSLPSLHTDVLQSPLYSKETLYPLIQLVVENIANACEPRILDIDGAKNHIFKDIFDCFLIYPEVNVSYSMTNLDEVSKKNQNYPLIPVKWNLSNPTEDFPNDKFDLIILKQILHKQENIKNSLSRAASLLNEGGFILVEEVTQNFPLGAALELLMDNYPNFSDSRSCGRFLNEKSWRSSFTSVGLEPVFERCDGAISSLFLLRKVKQQPGKNFFINATNPTPSWLSEAQALYKKVCESSDDRLWVVSDSATTGVPGFVRSLKLENPQTSKVRCIIKGDALTGEVLNITETSEIFKQLSKLDMSFNEYKDGCHGFTAALPLSTDISTHGSPSSHARLDLVKSPGGHRLVFRQMARSDQLAVVSYAAVNQMDVRKMTGRDRGFEQSSREYTSLGIEFSAVDSKGCRVFGCGKRGMISTHVDLASSVHLPVPKKMSMQAAASVFVPYSIALYALKVKVKARKGQSVLVHGAATAVSQAAIRVSLDIGLDVFLTVTDEEQKSAVLKTFPEIQATHVSLENPIMFDQMVTMETDGRGIDIVINTLSGNGRTASLKLLKSGGTLIDLLDEMADVRQDSASVSPLVGKNVACVDLMQLMFAPEFSANRDAVLKLMQDALAGGCIIGCETAVFPASDVTAAMAAAANPSEGKKVIIKFTDSVETKTSLTVRAVCDVTIDPAKSYVIIGGLAGFGLELAEWLVARGCRKLVLTGSSKDAASSAILAYRVAGWARQGVKVTCSQDACTTVDVTRGVLALALTLGPVGGVFVANKVNSEATFPEQTSSMYEEVFRATIQPIIHLDVVTQESGIKSTLDLFVAFTSMVGSRGRQGHSNSAFAGCYIARLCERRAKEGLPARCIQLGATGSPCVPAAWWDGEAGVCGTVAQSVRSCHRGLDLLLATGHSVTATYVLPARHSTSESQESGMTKLQKMLAEMMGAKDLSHLIPDATLFDNGLDSILTAEAQMALYQEYNLPMTPEQIGELTIEDLRNIDRKTFVLPK